MTNTVALDAIEGHLTGMVARFADTIERMQQGHTRQFHSIYQFVIEQGRLWRFADKPRTMRYGQERQCFANAGNASLRRRDLWYCEGYALRADVPMPIYHGWNIDRQGRVIDLTWRGCQERAYLGVIFRPEYLFKITARRESWGPLIDRPEDGFPVLTGQDDVSEAVQPWPLH